ncbi:hypothetical protein D7Y27_17055 [Corallococcus sp. AB004]|nr:hypothetical protein D7Y27_17055 [Corallococcus sp. AB004]
MMLHEAYYLIRPKPAVLAQAAALGLRDIKWLMEPQLWNKGEPDRSPWSRDDHLMQMKLLFLAWLRSEYGGQPEYKQLFGALPLSVESFDQGWFVERFYFPEPVSEIEKALKPEVVQALRETGHPNVDGWISELRQRR